MKRKHAVKLAAATAVGALTLAMTACDSPEGENAGGDGGEGGGSDEIRVGLAYDVGGRGDRSFNDSAYRGLQRVQEELGVSADDVQDFEPSEDESDVDKEERLKNMADQGFNVIIGVGYAYTEPMRNVASDEAYSDVHFAIVDSEIEDLDNVTSLVFTEEQASFLAGAAAALKTEEDHIGFVGGVENPLIKKFEAGYVAGAREINPDIEIEIAYLSQPPDMSGFSDPATGRSTAEGQFDSGADVVYHAAGASGNGVLEAAAEAERLFIGVDSDQYQTAPEDQRQYVLTSAIKQVDTAVFDFVQSVQEGDAQSGIQRFDLESGGVDYSTANEEEISDIQDQLDELKQRIIDGEIEVPTEP
ncbi:BMP family ABC transporter substrate-binding protein [Streptomonospora sp. S1-112]|uniref:BMP family ABC transporter substrate-binding protein n=1 Tax=Streptomonospora mangrovi TaxID=2883123 RepID=A0A9X3NRS9_9ACTN|nr:BMP family ABC transporter substrate-binding protein [Streptomonospora mangrovi]MDA0566889.1 BMP family ABC transporter substrate-binding protein [Streptomonospora mangrovi]